MKAQASTFKQYSALAARYGLVLSKDRKGWTLSGARNYAQRFERDMLVAAIAGELDAHVTHLQENITHWQSHPDSFVEEYIEQVRRVLAEVLPVVREAVA